MKESGFLSAICLAVWIGAVSAQAATPTAAPAVGQTVGQSAGPAAATTAFQPGQSVEVREGDTWSTATIEQREGRKYQIKYQNDSSEEWVTADRIRAVGTDASVAGVGAAAPAAPGSATAAPKPAVKPLVVNIGDQVEVKWGGSWRKAIVKNKGNGWTLINYTPGTFHEWVEPWRMRRVGSQTEIPWADGHKQLFKPEPPPKEPPGPMPVERSAGGSDDETDTSEVAPTTDANLAGVQEVVLGAQGGKWSLAPDAAPSTRPTSAQPIVLKGGVGNVFDKIAGPLIARQAGVAVILHSNTFRKDVVALEKLDLSAGASRGAVDMPTVVAACDVSDDGTTLLARSNGFSFGKSGRLDLWKIESAQPLHVISFLPYADREGSRRDIAWAKFVGADRVVTLNGEGRLIAWEVKSAKAIWAGEVSSVTPAVSAGGRQIAVVGGDRLAVIDSGGGKTLASLALTSKPMYGMLSFRPDGGQIALATEGLLRVWETAGGTLVSETPMSGASAQTIDWPSDGYVLLDGRELLSLSQKMPVWQYSGAKGTATQGGRIWYVADEESGKKQALVSTQLPEVAVKAAASSASSEEIWAARPGSSVSLDTGGLPGDIGAKASAALRAKLAANQFTVADGQPIKLVASVEAGKAVEIQYRKFGDSPFGGGGTKISATPQTMKIAFLDAEGKTLWQRQTTKSPPMSLMLKEGQTTEQAVAEATTPDASLFENVALPKFVAKAKYRNGLGTSSLTARGVSPAGRAQ